MLEWFDYTLLSTSGRLGKHKIPGQMTIEDFLGDLKDGGEKDMS